jgi:hypothetical protein
MSAVLRRLSWIFAFTALIGATLTFASAFACLTASGSPDSLTTTAAGWLLITSCALALGALLCLVWTTLILHLIETRR